MKKHHWILLLLILILLSGWESAARLNQDLLFVLPPPSQIAKRLLSCPGPFLLHSWTTLQEMLAGFGLALLLSLPCGWWMAHRTLPRLTLEPLFVITQCIPMFTLAPLMIVWFSWSAWAIIIPTALMIFFPLTITIYQGIRAVPPPLRELFQMYRASSWKTFISLELPSMLPHLFSGLKISAAIAGIGAIAGEWAGAQRGLGVFMQENRHQLDLEGTFGGIACLVGISLLFYGAILFVERLIIQRRSFRHSLSSLLAVAMMSLICTSCQNTAQQSHPATLVLDWLPNPNHVPLFAGIEKGIFQNHGIDLHILKTPDPGSPLAYLTARKTDLAIYYTSYAIRAASKGAHFRVIGTLIGEPLDALLFRADSDIHHLSDLSGKTIGFSLSTGGLGNVYLDVLRSKFGVENLETKSLNFDLIAALGAKRVDATFEAYWNIETAQLQALGVETRYIKLSELGVPRYSELIILASDHALHADPTLADRFRDALNESIAFCKANPEEAFQLYLKANSDKSASTNAWERASWEMTYPLLPNSQQFDKDMWETYQAWMLQHRLIEHPVKMNELLYHNSR